MTETMGVRRSLLVEGLVLLACLAGVTLEVGFFRDAGYVGTWYLEAAVVTFVILGGAWVLRSLLRPWWFHLDDRGLTFSTVLGGRQALSLCDLGSHLGHVVDLRRNRRFQVGEDRFPGAEKLHRAIRVRRAMEGLPQGDV